MQYMIVIHLTACHGFVTILIVFLKFIAGFFETILEEIKSVYSKITAKSCEKASSKMVFKQIISTDIHPVHVNMCVIIGD